MKIQGNDITGSNLIGEVKSADIYPNMELVKEVEILMNKYKVDYMWFAWSKFNSEGEVIKESE